MDFSESVLGRSTARQLRDRVKAPVLQIGSDKFTRSDLAAVTCFNFTAAQSVTRILTEELQVKNTRDLFERITPRDLALPRLGAISLAVIGAVFEAKGLGGANPLEAWMQRHADKDEAMVTFVSIKKREEHREEKKSGKAARRSKASRLRVGRSEGRLGATAASAATH